MAGQFEQAEDGQGDHAGQGEESRQDAEMREQVTSLKRGDRLLVPLRGFQPFTGGEGRRETFGCRWNPGEQGGLEVRGEVGLGGGMEGQGLVDVGEFLAKAAARGAGEEVFGNLRGQGSGGNIQ